MKTKLYFNEFEILIRQLRKMNNALKYTIFVTAKTDKFYEFACGTVLMSNQERLTFCGLQKMCNFCSTMTC